MTGAELMPVILFFVTVSGVLWAIWWRIEGKVDSAKAEAVKKASEAASEAASVRSELAGHKLHCAETYITKAGMRETRDEIMEAIHGVKQAVDHMTVRVDRIVESQASKPRPRTT